MPYMNSPVTILIVAIAFMSVGCSGKQISDEEAQKIAQIAKQNGALNAKSYIEQNPVYSEWGIVPDTDSTISVTCPNGDGWVTITLVSPDNYNTKKLICSSYSSDKGCLLADEFRKKTEYNDGDCDSTLPAIQQIAE